MNENTKLTEAYDDLTEAVTEAIMEEEAVQALHNSVNDMTDEEVTQARYNLYKQKEGALNSESMLQLIQRRQERKQLLLDKKNKRNAKRISQKTARKQQRK